MAVFRVTAQVSFFIEADDEDAAREEFYWGRMSQVSDSEHFEPEVWNPPVIEEIKP